MAPIVTLTMNPSLDVSADVERVVPDHKLRCSSPDHGPGGGGVNVARVARRLGAEVRAVLTAGGPVGAGLVDLVEAEGVDCVPVPIEGMTRQNPTFSETGSDRQYRFVLPGPRLTEPEWSACIDAVASTEPAPSIVVASGSLPSGVPSDLYARLVRTLDGTRVVVDASGAALREAAAVGPYLLKPNAAELTQLAGHPITADEEFEAAADQLVADGAAEVLVLSLGAGGAYLARRDGPGVSLRAPTVPIRSRIGAGDSMVAGIVTGLTRGWTVEDAVVLGLAAGAAAVMTDGSELARGDDVERLHGRMMSRAA